MALRALTIALAATLAAAAASAAGIRPAIVYELGGKLDGSFNEGVYSGAQRFREDTGIAFHEYEIGNDAQREQAMRDFAGRGFDPILVVGFAQAAALEKVAPEFPDTRFAIIDREVDLPNVASIVFKEHEGSYLVGKLAAMASKTGKIGFVGGMDIPLIRKFACGYLQGAREARPDIEVFQDMTGTTAAAWSDPVRGGKLATSQLERGADVVYHAAGGTGIGVLQAAADAGRLGIGVDSNQNHLHPGSVLTSMLKRVDIAAYTTFESAMDGSWQPGIRSLGLAEDGVGWALDENNLLLITEEMKTAVDRAQDDIIAGRIEVHDYTSDQNCPY